MSTSCSAEAGTGSTTVLNRRRSALDSSFTPRSRSLAVAMTLKPRDRLQLTFELRDRQRLLGQDGDQRVLHVRGHPGQLLDPRDLAAGHRAHHRAGHHRGPGRSLRDQPRVVPAVPDRFLGGPRGALHHQRRVAGDGRGQVLGQPGLRRARHAEQQQGPVGGQRGHGDLDEAARAHVLRRDLGAVGRGRPAGRWSPPTGTAASPAAAAGRRRRPARTARLVLLLRVRTQDRFGSRVPGVLSRRLSVIVQLLQHVVAKPQHPSAAPTAGGAPAPARAAHPVRRARVGPAGQLAQGLFSAGMRGGAR
jgi:hypothetical protein